MAYYKSDLHLRYHLVPDEMEEPPVSSEGCHKNTGDGGGYRIGQSLSTNLARGNEAGSRKDRCDVGRNRYILWRHRNGIILVIQEVKLKRNAIGKH
jgi:hypothetical protein